MRESLQKRRPTNIIKFDKNKTTFILCDCRSEILFIEYDDQIRLADFAIYENFTSHLNKMSFWQKIRYIWQIIWNHKPYGDQIVLNKDQLKQLKTFLDSLNLN